MAELSQEEKDFIRDNKLIKNAKYFHCINEEKGKTLEGKIIYDRDKWQCKMEGRGKKPLMHHIRDLDGLYPEGVGVEIGDLILTKDWVEFIIRYDGYEEGGDYYCGVDTGHFTNGKQVFYKGVGGSYHLKRFLSCKELQYWGTM